MSKFVIALIITIATVLFSFQNCQKSPYPDEINSQALNAVTISGRAELSQESLESVNLVVQDSQIVTKAGNTYQINYNKILKIDLKTGVVTETSDLDSNVAKYCLSEEVNNELISILKSSQVCITQPQLPEGTVCSQVYRLPYAQVFTSKEQYDLGSASDGCGSNSIDLCGDQSNLLKGYIENIKNQYKQLACQ